MPSETSQIGKDKYRMILLTCGIERTININKETKQKQTHGYRNHTDGCQRGGGLGGWVKKMKHLSSTDW